MSRFSYTVSYILEKMGDDGVSVVRRLVEKEARRYNKSFGLLEVGKRRGTLEDLEEAARLQLKAGRSMSRRLLFSIAREATRWDHHALAGSILKKAWDADSRIFVWLNLGAMTGQAYCWSKAASLMPGRTRTSFFSSYASNFLLDHLGMGPTRGPEYVPCGSIAEGRCLVIMMAKAHVDLRERWVAMCKRLIMNAGDADDFVKAGLLAKLDAIPLRK